MKCTGSDNADHYGWDSTNFVDSSISTNSAILNVKGESTNVGDSFFTNIESIDSNLEMIILYWRNPTSDITLNGNNGNDEFNFDYALSVILQD